MNRLFNNSYTFTRIAFNIISPKSYYGPVLCSNLTFYFFITFDVPSYLFNPILRIVAVFQLQLKFIPVFSMEEFPIAEYCDSIFRYCYIRLPREFQALPVPSQESPSSHDSLPGTRSPLVRRYKARCRLQRPILPLHLLPATAATRLSSPLLQLRTL